MTTGPTTSAAISAYVLTVWEAAVTALRQRNVIMDTITVYRDRSGTAQRSMSQFGTLSAFGTVAETDDVAAEQLTRSTLQTLTPYEFAKGIFITDTDIETDPEPVMANGIQELAVAAGNSVETNLAALMSSLTGGTLGAASTVITWGHVFAGITQLRQANVMGPLTLMCSNYQYHQLAKSISVAGLTLATVPDPSGLYRPFEVGRVGDVTIIGTNTLAGSTTNDCSGGLYAKDALAIDWRRMYRVEPERDGSKRGWEVTASMIYARGVWRPEKGIRMRFDSTAPTS